MVAVTETIEWFKIDDTLPDADTTVLIARQDDPEVWLGYYDGVHWRCIDGFKLNDVIHWAHPPKGPQQ